MIDMKHMMKYAFPLLPLLTTEVSRLTPHDWRLTSHVSRLTPHVSRL